MAESPVFEIEIELSKDSHRSQGHPQIQSSSGDVREKPKLPYLKEIKAASPQYLDTPSEGARGTKGLPYLKELLSSKIRRGGSQSRKASVHSVRTASFLESPINVGGLEMEPECLKTGKLLKTSKLRIESGHTKLKRFRFRTEQRFFRLTEEALEMYQHFNQVKLRRNYPLTSIDEIMYNEIEEPTVFHLLFQKYDMCLETETAEETASWVEAIRDAWSKWNIPESPIPEDTRPESPFSRQSSFDPPHRPSIGSQGPGLDTRHQPTSGRSSFDAKTARSHATPLKIPDVYVPTTEDAILSPAGPGKRLALDSDSEGDVYRNQRDSGSVRYTEETVVLPAPALDGDEAVTVEQISQLPYTTQRSHRPSSFTRPRAQSAAPMLRRESENYEFTLGRNKRKNAFRLAHLTPRLEMPEQPLLDPKPPRPAVKRSMSTVASDPESKQALNRLHSNFAMVKYPRTTLGIPHERIFKVDSDNLQILWRRNAAAGFRQRSSLKLHKVVEVREGQLTDSFEKFPYDEVKDQSLSLIFEEETKKYVRLTSIDLICDHPDNYKQWIEGLRSLVSGTKCGIYPHRYETTDPLVLWLKQMWTCKSDNHEFKFKDAINFIRKLQPQTSLQDAKLLIKISHSHQFRHTSEQGDLRWDGFTLLYNLVCTRAAPSCRLRDIFLKYATTYPALGLTTDELRTFLIDECYWSPNQTSDSELQELVKHHDYHHRAYKKYAAKNRPLQYQICTRLMSYAGFLSFLRSRDNAAIDLDHETVYQDMTLPLSHYFINSSHNTYLEADQLKGKSSLDAYIRALLQGCRCVEIDCWDDTFNVTGLESKEPIIYHGYTLTSKIPFREVVHIIRDYSFRTSLYPVIISIENHCSEDQQSKMAKIFRAIMGDILPSENLVETEGRERLPSPQELQGKIILKGSFKNRDKGTNKVKKRMSHEVSMSSLSSLVTNAVSPSRTSCVETTSPVRTASIEVQIDQPDSSLSPEAPHSAPPTDKSGQFRPHSHSFIRGRTSRKSLREVRDKVQQQEIGQDDQELVFEETSKDLKKLIVYCRSVSIKPWNWKTQRSTSVSEMFSFGEPTAISLCSKGKSTRDLLRCTERQLVRTYPKGTRFDSSNYDPIKMWNCGIQLVALNYQKPDICMHLNQGFFRRNGGCGYVLKPEVMRKEDPGGATAGSAPYSPFMKVAHPDVPSFDFEIELLSGQNLCTLNKKRASFTVDIHTYGIEHDTTKMSPSATHTDTLWPQWEEGEHKLSRTVIMPELCLVYFKVESDRRLLGQNCICLVSLQPGIKFIPMRTSGGELIPEAGLFVKIKKSEQDGHLFDRYTNKNTSTGKEGLETISEHVEASLPVSTRKLKRQKDVGEDADSLRRTMSSPPSITTVTNERKALPTNKMEVEVEVIANPPPEESMPGVRSLTILPNYPTAQSPVSETTDELLASDNVVEFTLTVQGSFDQGPN